MRNAKIKTIWKVRRSRRRRSGTESRPLAEGMPRIKGNARTRRSGTRCAGKGKERRLRAGSKKLPSKLHSRPSDRVARPTPAKNETTASFRRLHRLPESSLDHNPTPTALDRRLKESRRALSLSQLRLHLLLLLDMATWKWKKRANMFPSPQQAQKKDDFLSTYVINLSCSVLCFALCSANQVTFIRYST